VDDAALQQPMLGGMDRITQATAMRISRRSLFKGAVASGIVTAIGLPLFEPLAAAATNCHTCYGPCGRCSSHIERCCSPNLQYCFWGTCTCPCMQRGCSSMNVEVTACDDGGYSVSCPCACWFGCASCC
jgi:hypothetical protein